MCTENTLDKKLGWAGLALLLLSLSDLNLLELLDNEVLKIQINKQ